MIQVARIAAIVLLLGNAACDFPQDADGTLDRVRQNHVLSVGVSERPPWISVEGNAVSGIEADLLRRWAGRLDAQIRWITGSESELVQALRKRQIDVVAAGLTTRSQWTEHAAATQPCARFRAAISSDAPSRDNHVMLVAPGESAFLLEFDRFLSRTCRAAALNESTDEAGQAT
jgi:ABC-type amino acid transport substrate-binding protein